MDEINIPRRIVGSLRKGSYNQFSLKAAQELVPDGAVLRLVELQRSASRSLIRMMKWR